LFSYTDTQLSRLGGPNFHEIPINRSINTVHNNQRDGHMRMQINKGKSSYNPNSTGGGCPFQAKMSEGGFTSYDERIDAHKVRNRSKSFFDHFSQAKLFYNSQAPYEQQHIKDALSFELSKVMNEDIRQRMIDVLTNVDMGLAQYVADKTGMPIPKKAQKVENKARPADAYAKDYAPVIKEPSIDKSAALSMANTVKDSIDSRQIAVLVADGVDDTVLSKLEESIKAAGGETVKVAPKLGKVKGSAGNTIACDKTLFNSASVLFDAVYVPGGEKSIKALSAEPDAIHFVNEAYRHCKAIGMDKDAGPFIEQTNLQNAGDDEALITDGNIKAFIKAVAQHRLWQREAKRKVPA